MAGIDNIILRDTTFAPYTNKGSELTWNEEDENFIFLAEAIRSLQQADQIGGVLSYDASTTYELDDLVTYGGNLWQYINAVPHDGVTPGTDSLTWELTSSGILSHKQDTDQYLDFGGTNEVSAYEIRSFIDGTSSGSFLPLSAGSGFPLEGDLYMGGHTIYSNNQNIIQNSTHADNYLQVGAGGVVLASDSVLTLHGETTVDIQCSNGYRAKFSTSALTADRAKGFLDYAGTLAQAEMHESILYTSGYGIDTTATGGSDVLNIGATNANTINYGNSSTTHNFLGTAIYELQVNSYVTDKLMTLNYGGSVSSGIGVGFEIEENSVITGYLKTNAARTGYSFKAPANTSYTDLIFSATSARSATFKDSSGTVAWTSDITAAAVSPLTIKGDVWTYSTVNARLGVGTDGYVLTADSTQATGLKWASVASGNVFADNVFRIQDNGDATKQIAFEASGITTGTTRTLTVQDANGTLALSVNNLSFFAATTSAQLLGVISDETGSGSLVFATSPTLVTPTLGIASSTSLSITGTGGAGFIEYVGQSSAPSAPSGVGIRIFSGSTGNFSWMKNDGGSDLFRRTISGTLTANRIYTLVDSAFTFAGIDIAQSFTAKQTFTGSTTEMLSISLLDTTYKSMMAVTGSNAFTIASGMISPILTYNGFTWGATGWNCPTTTAFTNTSGSISFTFGNSTNGLRTNKNTNLNSSTTGYFFTMDGTITSSGSAVINGAQTTSITVNNTLGTIGVNMYSAAPTITALNTGGLVTGYRSAVPVPSSGAGKTWNFYNDSAASPNAFLANTSFGQLTSPTAYVHLGAGTATAGTAPWKLTSGTNMTTAETGAWEYNGTNLFFTRTGTTRETILSGIQSALNALGLTAITQLTNQIKVNIGGNDYYIPCSAANTILT